MVNVAKSLLDTISSDFRVYGYTPATHVEQALVDVRNGHTSFKQFRKVMISGISYSLKNNRLD